MNRIRTEHLLELTRNAEETARIARDAHVRAIQNGTESAIAGMGFRRDSMRVHLAMAAIEAALTVLQQAAAHLRSPQSGIYPGIRRPTDPPPEDV